jgi:hypothetical protein
MKEVVKEKRYGKIVLRLVHFKARDWSVSEDRYTVTGKEWQGEVTGEVLVNKMLMSPGHSFNIQEYVPSLSGECLVTDAKRWTPNIEPSLEFSVIGVLKENGLEVR